MVVRFGFLLWQGLMEFAKFESACPWLMFLGDFDESTLRVGRLLWLTKLKRDSFSIDPLVIGTGSSFLKLLLPHAE